MDSDEEQLLVIDEGLLVETNPPAASPQIVQMEVADTSQDDSNGATSAQSESNSSEKSTEQTVHGLQQSPEHPKPTSSLSSSSHKRSSSHKSSRRESSHDRHKSSSHKSHDRSKEHRTHNDRDKKASTTTSHDTPKKEYKKRNSHTNWFKLSHLTNYKSKELNISALKHQFYNMRLHVYRGKMVVCDMPEVYPAPSTVSDLSLSQLFNFPGIGFTLQLEHFSITYDFKTNIQRDIVIGNDDYIDLKKDEENVLETRYIQNHSSKKEQRTVSKDLLKCYLNAILQAIPLHDIPKSKLSEADATFQKIIELISGVNDDLIEMKSTHSQFMNKYKYVRTIDNHTDQSCAIKAKIREIMNPEGTFRIDRCTLSMEEMDVWFDAIETYFEEILITRRGQDAKSLKDRIKKCLTMRCEMCSTLFEGAMSTVSMKEHVKEKHFFDKPWECTFCKKSWTQFELTDMMWKHECTTIEDEEATITSSQG